MKRNLQASEQHPRRRHRHDPLRQQRHLQKLSRMLARKQKVKS